MIKNKKILLGALSFATLTAPFASVIACGNCDNSNDGGDYVDKTGFNPLFDQAREIMNKRLELISQIDSTTLVFEDAAFQYDFKKEWDSLDLGLIYPDGSEPFPPGGQRQEGYYVEEVDQIARTVKIRCLFVDISDNNLIANATFFTLENFGIKYDLSNFTEISPRANDSNIKITNLQLADPAEVQTALTGIAKEYLVERVANVADGDYNAATITWTNADGSEIIAQDLTKQATSYIATISASADSKTLQNETTLTINLPQFNAYDISVSLADFTAYDGDWTVSDKTKVPTSFIIYKVNKLVLDRVQGVNANVTWDDLFPRYSIGSGTALPQWLDLTTQQILNLELIALPNSKKALNSKTINITLPALVDEEIKEKS